MKKIKIVSLACVLILCLCGCMLTQQRIDPPPSNAYRVDEIRYTDEFSQSLQYRHLTKAEQICYGQVYTALRDHNNKNSVISNEADQQTHPGLRIAISGVQLTKDELSRVFEAILHDNPQFFYLDRTYSLEGHEIDGQSVYDTLVLQYTLTAEARNLAAQQLNSVVDDILAGRPQTSDDYEVERYLHDRLLAICSYDNEAASASSQQFANAYSVYGALVEGKAVCEGYAKAMQLLLNRSGIPATVVLGQSLEDGIAHMWNLVKINGSFYYLDATWNDHDQQPQYAYFNVTSDQLKRTHIIAEQLYIENCTAQSDNFYIRNNAYIDSYDRDEIAETIARQIQTGATVVHLQCGDGKFENALLFLKNASLTQKMVNNHLTSTIMWNYELHIFSDQNIITIKKI